MSEPTWTPISELRAAREYEDGTWILLTSTWNKYMRVAVCATDGMWLDMMERDHTEEVEKNKGSATHYMLWPTDPPNGPASAPDKQGSGGDGR